MPGIPCFCGDTDDGPESETQVRRQRGAGSERVQKAGVQGSTGRRVDQSTASTTGNGRTIHSCRWHLGISPGKLLGILGSGGPTY